MTQTNTCSAQAPKGSHRDVCFDFFKLLFYTELHWQSKRICRNWRCICVSLSLCVCYRGEEHNEEVDGGLGDVAAPDGHHDGRKEGQVTEREQQSCQQLAPVRLSWRIISAAPTAPSCAHKDTDTHRATTTTMKPNRWINTFNTFSNKIQWWHIFDMYDCRLQWGWAFIYIKVKGGVSRILQKNKI